MKKLGLTIVLSFFVAGMISAADAPANPFERYDKEIKKLEDKQTKEKDKKKIDNIKADIKKAEEKKDKELKKLATPFETEREKLITDIDKAKEKDKNADVTVKQTRLDYVDKMIQYYNDLYAGKTAELPKDPAKTPPPAKDGAKADPADAADKAKKALSGDLAK
ncbi:MAG TPA: hypothetical protein DET40_15210 [Lentisphaeria bacterium]|nr:MAG: hypothetical protein A2X45_21830 [Lentisphaerae bacterium GWF2_50_93]HCE44888.1 hypothetical protein [Lentisphaeria bacterium]